MLRGGCEVPTDLAPPGEVLGGVYLELYPVSSRRRRACDVRLSALEQPPVVAVRSTGLPVVQPCDFGHSLITSPLAVHADSPGAPGALLRHLLACAEGGSGAAAPAQLDTLTGNSRTVGLHEAFLKSAGLESAANRFRQCGSMFRADRIRHRPGCAEDQGELHIQRCQCGLVSCPVCQAPIARQSARLTAARLGTALTSQPNKSGRKVLHIVLTLRSGLEADGALSAKTIREHHRHGAACIRELWRRVPWLARHMGSTRKVEVGASGAVHYHLVTVGIPWVNPQWLSKLWHDVSGSPVVWVSRAHQRRKARPRARAGAKLSGRLPGLAGVATEVSKYISKPTSHGAWWLGPMVAVALHGERRWESYGALRGVATEAKHWVRSYVLTCPCCGGDAFHGRWQVTPEAALESLSTCEEERGRGPPDPAGRPMVRPPGWEWLTDARRGATVWCADRRPDALNRPVHRSLLATVTLVARLHSPKTGPGWLRG